MVEVMKYLSRFDSDFHQELLQEFKSGDLMVCKFKTTPATMLEVGYLIGFYAQSHPNWCAEERVTMCVEDLLDLPDDMGD